MASWHSDLAAALKQRDLEEKRFEQAFNAYSRLADRHAAESEHHARQLPKRAVGKDDQTWQKDIDPKEAMLQMRHDLGEAQKSRKGLEADLQKVNKELRSLRIQTSGDNRRITDLNKEKTILARSLGDRDEEIKAKAKLLDNVHDETVSLTLQLNMADERTKKLESENADLVARWMRRMGEEADQMNERSKFI